MFSSAISPADIAAISKADNNGSWDNGSFWIIILFILILGGGAWGANNSINDQYVLASDMANISRQIDSQTADIKSGITAIGNGISSLGYDQLNQINSVNTNIMQSQNAIQSQLSAGFCGINSSIKDANYNVSMQIGNLQNAMQSGFCQTNYNNSNNTRDIIDSQNCNTQAIIARIDRLESNAQQDKIAQLQAENTRLMFAASQQAQNAYLIEQLKTTSV